jgi:hypothetical protein
MLEGKIKLYRKTAHLLQKLPSTKKVASQVPRVVE